MQTILSNITTGDNDGRLFVPNVSSAISKYLFDIDLFHTEAEGRTAAEHFIEMGYLKSYGAHIKVTAPWLLAINKGEYKAALGIRPATELLFLEQYIRLPIERTLAKCCEKVDRNEIAEIGNLYSNANKFTMPLFLTTAVSLFFHRYKYMVFSATEHVLDLISRTGISYTVIGVASQSMLSKSHEKWGSYYSTNPQVVALNLSDVMAVISANKRFMAMFKALGTRIANAASKMSGKPS